MNVSIIYKSFENIVFNDYIVFYCMKYIKYIKQLSYFQVFSVINTPKRKMGK